MKKIFRAHPLMTVRLIKPFLFVLILPLIKGAIQYLLYQKISGVLALEFLAFGFITALALIRCRFFTVCVNEQSLTVKSGVLIKSESVIRFSSLSSVTTKRNLLDFIFGTVDCCINTEAGKRNSPDFSLKLKRSDALELFSGVYGNTGRTAITFSPVKISVMAATTSSAFTGLIIGVPVINNIGKLLGVALSDMLLTEIDNASRGFNTYFPPIVNAVTIVFLIGYGLSFMISLLKHLKFRLFMDKNRIEVRSGLFVARRTVFKKSSVNDICIEQTPFMRLFGVFSLTASVAGYGISKGEKATLIPCGKRNEINRHLWLYFPRFAGPQTFIRAAKTKREKNRALLIPRILGFSIVGVTATAMLIFPYFDRLILFVGLVLGVVTLYYRDLCLFSHYHGRISFGDCIKATGRHRLSWRELHCDKERVGLLKIIKTPADRRFGTCKLKLTVCSESSDSLRVRNMATLDVLKAIKSNIGIDV